MGIFSAVARFLLAEAYYEIGDYENSRDQYEKAAWLVEQSGGFHSWLTHNELGAMKAKVMRDEREIDLETLYAYANENKLRLWDGWKARFVGEILLNIDDQHMPEAEDWINRAIEMHKRDTQMWYLASDYRLYAELFKRKGDMPKAKENLIKAIEIFEECGADGWVKKTEKELASFS
jgi:tetratricopeptide (TPR) repeat protein